MAPARLRDGFGDVDRRHSWPERAARLTSRTGAPRWAAAAPRGAAGSSAASTPMTTNVPPARSPVCGVTIMPEKRIGIGARLMSAHRPRADEEPEAARQRRQEEALQEELPLNGRASSRPAPSGRRSRCVRSLTAISMMFITPMPPSASVTSPTIVKNWRMLVDHAAEHQRAERGVPHRDRLAILGVEALVAREDRPHLPLERPVDVLDAPVRPSRLCGRSSTTHGCGATRAAATRCRRARRAAAGRAASRRTARTSCCCPDRCSCCPGSSSASGRRS